MAQEDVVVRYRAEVDELTRQLKVIAEKQEQIAKGAQKVNEQFALFDKRGNQIGAAFSTKPIEGFNKEIGDSQKNVKGFSNTVKDESSKITSSVGNLGRQLAGAFGIAFSVQQVIAFSKATIDAFLEAEETASRLKFAVSEIAKEGDTVFDGLIKQSKELQKITIFSSGSIQQAQTLLATFDLTGQQIEELIPKLADFATVTGTDIVTAANSVGQGIQGMGKAFEKYGIEVSATKTEQQNFNSLLEGFSKFQGAAADATQTTTGRLKQQSNQINDLQERLGEKLLPTMNAIRGVAVRALTGIVNFFTKSESASEKAAKKFTEVSTEFNLLVETLKRGNLTQEQRGELIKQINEQYGEYLPNLLTEKSSLDEINLAQKAVNDSITSRIVLMQQEEEISKIIQNTIAANKDLIQVEIERIKLQTDLSDNATLAAAKQEELNRRQALANAIIEDSKKRLADLQKSYADLAARLGLNTDAQSKLKNEIDGTREATDKLVTALDAITPEQAIKQLTVLQNLRLTAATGSIADFRDAVQELSEELNKVADTDFENELTRQNKERVDAAEKTNKELQDLRDLRIQQEKDANEQILQNSAALASELSSLFQALGDRQIEEIERVRERRLEDIDEELENLTDQRESKLINEEDFEKRSAQLKQKRVDAEKKATDEINKIKKKQAILDKLAAIFNIIINTQQAISLAMAQLATFSPPVIALLQALGALQVATVLAQPIPKFEKGTKKKKGSSLALVGEQGPEVTYLPDQAKVLPAREVRTYGKVLDAMFDNNLDRYVHKTYVAPALIKQQQKHEAQKQQEFAQNISNSFAVQNIGGTDEYGVRRAMNAAKMNLNKGSADYLINGIADKIKPDFRTL